MPLDGGGRLPVVPPVRAEGVPHRARRVERQRRDIHAPAGSAGGVPRRGARAGDAPGFVGALACGARVEPAAGWRGRQRQVLDQPVEILAVDRLALEQRVGDPVEQLAVAPRGSRWRGRRPRRPGA